MSLKLFLRTQRPQVSTANSSARFFFSIFLLCQLNTAAQAQPSSPSAKLGAILCLTGDLAMDCGAFREGIELAVEEINSHGGVAGRKIVVDIQDSGRVPKVSQTLAKKFGTDPDILGVITSTFFEAKNSSPALEKYGVPSMVLWDSTPELEAMGNYTFAIGPWAPSTYEVSARFARESLKASKAGVIATIEEWAQSVASGFERSFKAAGGNIVDRVDVNAGDADFRSIVSRIARRSPDVLYVPVNPHLEALVRQIREQGLTCPIITSDNITTALLRTNPKVFAGVYQSMVADPTGVETHELAKKYQARFGHPADLILFVGWGYDAVRLYANAMASGGFSRTSIRDALAHTRDFRGASGTITINPEGSSRMMASMFRIEEDTLVPIRAAPTGR